jgi:hypothetical protein
VNRQAEADVESQAQSQVLTMRISPHEFNRCMAKMLRFLQEGPPTIGEMFEWRAEARLKEGENRERRHANFANVVELATISQVAEGEEQEWRRARK